MSDGQIGGRAAFNWDGVPVKLPVTQTADPGAGNQAAAITVPSTVRWLVQAVSCSIVCSGVAVSRIPHLQIKHNGATITADFYGSSFIAASETVQISACPQAQNIDASPQGGYVISIGWIELPPGATIQLLVAGLDAGDDLSAVTLTVKEARP